MLQLLDTHSTLRALSGGAREGNPVAGTMVSSPGVLLATKAATVAGTVYLVERLQKKNRVAAIVLMAAVNSCYLAIVTHNYRAVR